MLCCGLMVSSPGPCASSGGRLPEAFFMVFLLDSKGAKVCKSCRSRQELSNVIATVFVQIFIFQSLSMSLFLNFFSNEIAIQTSIYLQNLASIQPRTGLSKFAKKYPKVRKKVRKNIGRSTSACPSASRPRGRGKRRRLSKRRLERPKRSLSSTPSRRCTSRVTWRRCRDWTRTKMMTYRRRRRLLSTVRPEECRGAKAAGT